MEIIIGKNSGFCAGVKSTIQRAEALGKEKKTIYCLGELVHNERIIHDLEKEGFLFKENIEEIPDNQAVIFRAHGEKKEVLERAIEKNLTIYDLACGKVLGIRKKTEKNKEDSTIVIIGKKSHPETIGTRSYAGEDAFVIETEEDIQELKNRGKDKLYIVAQTTFSKDLFQELIEKIKKTYPIEIKVDNTICDATEKRQEETKELAKEVDKMIIIGGKNSSNTKELYNISKEIKPKTYLIQGREDLDLSLFQKEDKIGIMAGASTPYIVVEEVIKELEKIKEL